MKQGEGFIILTDETEAEAETECRKIEDIMNRANRIAEAKHMTQEAYQLLVKQRLQAAGFEIEGITYDETPEEIMEGF
jgi:uncharacterized protein YfbU (UPF0304 family)